MPINNINLKEKQALKEYKDLLLKNLPNQIAQMILFGSKARGDSHKDSDIDVLVVTNWGQTDRKGWRKIVGGATDILLKFDDVLISPKIKTKQEFQHSCSPLVQNIKKEGIRLWSPKQKNNLLDCW